jgi:hypothetical protein
MTVPLLSKDSKISMLPRRARLRVLGVCAVRKIVEVHDRVVRVHKMILLD